MYSHVHLNYYYSLLFIGTCPTAADGATSSNFGGRILSSALKSTHDVQLLNDIN